ncbi:MAG: DUF952 domain-containing protein [Pseudomonadota bacterium]
MLVFCSMETLYHITTGAEADQGRDAGSYTAPSLSTEGFIHCAFEHQVAGVLERYYQGMDDLVMLTIDPTALASVLKLENTTGGEEQFPHVYGPIPWTSVVAVGSVPAR